MESILKLKNISMNYQTESGEVCALKDISIELYKNELLSIVGPSGCGKSTLLSIISGLENSSNGEIISEKEYRYGYMFQNDCLMEWKNLYENIILPLKIKKEMTDKNIEKTCKLIDDYGLSEFKNKYPSQISGGMRQRCALIRTLTINPDILLLDEPFSALDYQTRLSVSDDILEIIKNEKKTAIMVTHDISESICMSDRVIVLSKRPGKIKKIIKINKFDKATIGNKRRKAEAFNSYFDEIWSELDALT